MDPNNGYTYDATNNAIDFNGNSIPSNGATIQVNYNQKTNLEPGAWLLVTRVRRFKFPQEVPWTRSSQGKLGLIIGSDRLFPSHRGMF